MLRSAAFVRSFAVLIALTYVAITAYDQDLMPIGSVTPAEDAVISTIGASSRWPTCAMTSECKWLFLQTRCLVDPDLHNSGRDTSGF